MLKLIKFTTLLCVLGILLLMIGCGEKSANQPALPVNTAQSASIVSYTLPDMDKIIVKKDIIYDDYNKLNADIYYPLGYKDSTKAPTVILVHGIANDNDLKDNIAYISWGKVLAASGFTAITFNWRSSFSSARDVSGLTKYMRENSKKLNINSENICVFAFSAGVLPGIKDAMDVNTGFIKKVIAYYGQIDESILTPKANVKLPTFFIAMAAQDSTYPQNANDSFISKAKAAGCNVTSMVQPNGVHGFDIFNDNAQTKNIIDKTLKFIWEGGSL